MLRYILDDVLCGLSVDYLDNTQELSKTLILPPICIIILRLGYFNFIFLASKKFTSPKNKIEIAKPDYAKIYFG